MGIHLPVRSALLCVHPSHVGIYGGQRVEIREQPCGVGSLLTFTQVLPGCEAKRLHPSVLTCERRALHMLSKRSAAELRPHTQASENPLVSGGGLENLTGCTSCDKNLRGKSRLDSLGSDSHRADGIGSEDRFPARMLSGVDVDSSGPPAAPPISAHPCPRNFLF